MPKKTRKAKIRASQRPINTGYAPAAPRTGPVAPTLESTRETFVPRAAAAPMPVVTRSATPASFDYGYVYRDLRRIGLLALAFFAIMFVLWYVVEVQGIHLIPGVF